MELPEPTEKLVGKNMKLTPAAGYKNARAKKGEVRIGHRVYGDTDIFSKPKNYNFNLRRENEEKIRFNFIKFLTIVSLVPVAMLLYNAENRFKNAEVKQISAKRRQRLDKEYGVDREQMTQDFQKLDEFYRYSEKKEIEKFQRIGRSASQFYEQ